MRKLESLKLALPLAFITWFGAVACTAAETTQPSKISSCQPGLFTSLKINERAQGGTYADNTGACGAVTNPVGEKRVAEIYPGQLFVLVCKDSEEAATVVVNYRGILGSVALTPELAATDLVGPAGPVPLCEGAAA